MAGLEASCRSRLNRSRSELSPEPEPLNWWHEALCVFVAGLFPALLLALAAVLYVGQLGARANFMAGGVLFVSPQTAAAITAMALTFAFVAWGRRVDRIHNKA